MCETTEVSVFCKCACEHVLAGRYEHEMIQMRKCMQMCMCESVFKWEHVSIGRKGVYVRLYWSVNLCMSGHVSVCKYENICESVLVFRCTRVYTRARMGECKFTSS